MADQEHLGCGVQMSKEKAIEVVSSCLLEDSTGFESLAERLHRIENCRLDGDFLSFDLQRHPDDWTSVQHFQLDVRKGNLTLVGEEIVELFVTGESLVESDLDSFFEGVGLTDFDGCLDLADVLERASSLAQQFLPTLSENWSYLPEEIEQSPSRIRKQWEKARIHAVEIYTDQFVARARDEWLRTS